ncbi:hypothetical protein [Streptomyces yangpuensis]|uniref:hypothetical protein n=1 Tax=Streptomyces yangpuensis TaxID=1648182 RepID=UPI0006997F16|nr:hypothetical protein [Streptomyces yangpuensis]
MTANGFIRRGPMAADVFEQQFTRIHNAVFRDRRMSYKAKGIFGLISTHRDGFGLSIESLTSFSTDGVSAVRTGLNELEKFGYLQRDQQRLDGPTADNPNAKKGSFGAVEYFITDMPDGLVISIPAPAPAPEENPSSDPSCENRTTEGPKENRSSDPSCDFPHADEPHAEDHRRKKNNPQKNISLSGLPSSPGPQESTPVGTQTRETAAPEDNPAPATAEVPAPRSGQAAEEQPAELLEMLRGLPGRMHRDDAADLLPLAAEALAAGWTVPRLRDHLSRRCDPDRVFNVAAIYRMQLKKLPSAPAGAGAHPAAAAPACSKCNGSGLAEDPETFLPIGPCECRKAPALAAAS